MAGVTGIVLAAGAGRRMGGPKALIGPEGPAGPGHITDTPERSTPLERVCRHLHAGGCPQVLAVVGAEAHRVAAALPSRPWLELVTAVAWEEGMGASLRAGLAAAGRTGADAAVVTLVDLPDVGADVVARLLAEAPPTRGSLARASYRGTPGHPVLLGRDWWPRAAAASVGDVGARALFASEPHQLVECGDLATGRDADTPSG